MMTRLSLKQDHATENLLINRFEHLDGISTSESKPVFPIVLAKMVIYYLEDLYKTGLC